MLASILLFPLLGFLINGLWYWLLQSAPGNKKAHATAPGIIATTAIFLAFVQSIRVFMSLQGQEPGAYIEETLFSWIEVANLKIPFTLRVDALNSLFLLVITGVGTLIHLYSMGYMHHDETPGKFFAYLNLFCVMMLVLVSGGSLPILFLGWEGVGLCSYLLIGYWYADEEKASAGKKAFIVNRIGDLGFLIGMFLIWTHFQTLDFAQIKEIATAPETLIPTGIATAIGLALFVGCMGKSAQIPLYIWLPDAMAGPTPVSALIHAATMVTSGIYMLSRLSYIYQAAPDAMAVIAWVGGLTALFAATIAVVQTDIKKVLAYSTVSQLGYMFLACGVGAFSAGVFHVITHAFFKALLFLGAGSVIHGMHEEQNIMKMGGLKSKMPITYFIFLIGLLAISGIPPFSGFFSKDEILWMAFSGEHGSKMLWFIGMLTAAMTAFYMTRLFALTFLGKQRSDVHAHESPLVMTLPLLVLAVASAVGGAIGIPHSNWLAHWLEPVVGAHGEPTVSASLEWVLMALSAGVAIVMMTIAFRFYRNLDRANAMAVKYPALYRALYNKWYVDEAYERIFIQPFYSLSRFFWKVIDVSVIDRIVLAFGGTAQLAGESVRLTQTGRLQVYGAFILFGLLITVGFLIYGMA